MIEMLLLVGIRRDDDEAIFEVKNFGLNYCDCNEFLRSFYVVSYGESNMNTPRRPQWLHFQKREAVFRRRRASKSETLVGFS